MVFRGVLRFKKGFPGVCVQKGFLGVWFSRRFRVVHVLFYKKLKNVSCEYYHVNG